MLHKIQNYNKYSSNKLQSFANRHKTMLTTTATTTTTRLVALYIGQSGELVPEKHSHTHSLFLWVLRYWHGYLSGVRGK